MKLKPCPFLHEGSQEQELKVVRSDTWWFVSCEVCAAQGPYEQSRALAVKGWNSRK